MTDGTELGPDGPADRFRRMITASLDGDFALAEAMDLVDSDEDPAAVLRIAVVLFDGLLSEIANLRDSTALSVWQDDLISRAAKHEGLGP